MIGILLDNNYVLYQTQGGIYGHQSYNQQQSTTFQQGWIPQNILHYGGTHSSQEQVLMENYGSHHGRDEHEEENMDDYQYAGTNLQPVYIPASTNMARPTGPQGDDDGLFDANQLFQNLNIGRAGHQQQDPVIINLTDENADIYPDIIEAQNTETDSSDTYYGTNSIDEEQFQQQQEEHNSGYRINQIANLLSTYNAITQNVNVPTSNLQYADNNSDNEINNIDAREAEATFDSSDDQDSESELESYESDEISDTEPFFGSPGTVSAALQEAQVSASEAHPVPTHLQQPYESDASQSENSNPFSLEEAQRTIEQKIIEQKNRLYGSHQPVCAQQLDQNEHVQQQAQQDEHEGGYNEGSAGADEMEYVYDKDWMDFDYETNYFNVAVPVSPYVLQLWFKMVDYGPLIGEHAIFGFA